MGNLNSDADISRSAESYSGEVSGKKNLSFTENQETPVYILDSKYEEGFVHWIPGDRGKNIPVVCAGGVEGKGFNPDVCPVCKKMLELYQQGKSLRESGETEEADRIKDAVNKYRAKYSAVFIAAKGEWVTYKNKAGKKEKKAEFDENTTVGLLSMSEAQFDAFKGLINSTGYPFIKSGKDLSNRVLAVKKEKAAGNRYATTSFIPAKLPSPAPKVDFSEIDISSNFTPDIQALKKVAREMAAIVGGESVVEDEDEGVETVTMGKQDMSDIGDNDFEDDIPELPKKKVAKRGSKKAPRY